MYSCVVRGGMFCLEITKKVHVALDLKAEGFMV